jgi:MFS family permease
MFQAEFLCGFDGTIVGGFQALPSWRADLGHPGAAKIGLLNAISSITGFLIGPVNAYVCDHWGRRWPLRAYGFTMCFGTVLGVLAGVKQGSAGFGLFLASKAIIGAGMQAGLVTSIICMQEITHPRNRPVMAALYGCNWVLGSTISSFITFGTSFLDNSWSWVSISHYTRGQWSNVRLQRIPYLIQMIPAFYILFATYLVPETPRFLLSKGRDAEAMAFLVKVNLLPSARGMAQPKNPLFTVPWQWRS